eukprot:TRINITY_DN2750_c0_g3_i1.p1 TRINITY_DN2750_c0_g3~~TRINITY_DN2750_c0_g3_i1.p1  ORF type:complete len:279 (-),score=40.58 TRINITY_DN2750_c0_g3_i1:19-855(-)
MYLKLFFLQFLMCFASATILSYNSEDLSSDDTLLSLFEKWSELHNKSYATEEKSSRFRVFKENLFYIEEHNSKGNSSYVLGLNAFADLTYEEFKERVGIRRRLPLSRSKRRFESSKGRNVWLSDIPNSLDWREKGAVTEVKDQGSCGACWAFSATGAIEGINQIVTGSLISLSEQELCDCDTLYNQGCDGGLMDPAFQWVIDNGGIDTEEDYPFVGVQKYCNTQKRKRHIVSIDSYADVPESNEKELLYAVASQPVSVGINGGGTAFQLYSGGIFDGP